jgi:hypothetical protein
VPTHQALTKTGSLSKSSTRDLKEQGLSGSPGIPVVTAIAQDNRAAQNHAEGLQGRQDRWCSRPRVSRSAARATAGGADSQHRRDTQHQHRPGRPVLPKVLTPPPPPSCGSWWWWAWAAGSFIRPTTAPPSTPFHPSTSVWPPGSTRWRAPEWSAPGRLSGGPAVGLLTGGNHGTARRGGVCYARGGASRERTDGAQACRNGQRQLSALWPTPTVHQPPRRRVAHQAPA